MVGPARNLENVIWMLKYWNSQEASMYMEVGKEYLETGQLLKIGHIW